MVRIPGWSAFVRRSDTGSPLFWLTASRLSGIVCKVIANTLAKNTHNFFFLILLYIFILREFVRLRHNRLFLYWFARLVLRWFTVISLLFYSDVFLAVNVLRFISPALILSVIQSELSGSSQRWPLLWIQPALVLIVDPANAGPLLD